MIKTNHFIAFCFSLQLFIPSSLLAQQACKIKNSYFFSDEFEHKIKSKDLGLKLCRKLGVIDSQAELNSLLNKHFEDLDKISDPDRQKTNQKFNDCLPSSSSKALVIAFEGTNAYEPKIPAALARITQCFAGKIDKALVQKLNYSAHKVFANRYKKNPSWSGLASGPFEEIASRSDGANIDWFSFPSEELEQIGGKPIFQKDTINQVFNDIKNSFQKKPQGIRNALACIDKYQKAAAAMNIKPKIILTSHSSGGTALVKFAEHLKKQSNIQIDLAFSIDPVREAHEAFREVVIRGVNPLDPQRHKPLVVSSQLQKDKLYKPTNIKTFCNFYQRLDSAGLEMGFGIHGSPVYKAQNIELKNMGEHAHGEIAYHPTLVKSFHDQLDYLLYNKGDAACK